jgi:hypothetical protein
MGSPHTLADGELVADQAFARLNPTLGRPQDPHDPTRRTDVRDHEDVATRGDRLAHADWTENDLPAHQAIQALGDRAQRAHPDPEHTFDQLNPTFGVPADHHDPLGRQAVRDREAALALGTRVAVASMRENDRDPGIRLAGQDYRAADAIHAARTQTVYVWRPVQRVGAER